MQNKVNHHIQCNVSNCANHCSNENYCALECICVGSCAGEQPFAACTDCQSYRCSDQVPATNLDCERKTFF
ncbi:MAG: DUF1540 domain-containing protein [Oscillospiraceae bacterium]